MHLKKKNNHKTFAIAKCFVADFIVNVLVVANLTLASLRALLALTANAAPTLYLASLECDHPKKAFTAI